MRQEYPDLVKQGQIDEALKLVTADVKKNPSDPQLRVFLFQLLCVLGEWKRALNQLDVAAELDPKALLMAAMYRPALAAEPFRKEVHEGKKDPLIFGEPEQWMGLLLKANRLEAEGNPGAAEEMRGQAFEAAPASPGTLDGEKFEWIADSDQHFGPMIEAIIQNKYYWVPMMRVRHVELEPPSDLRDLVWSPAQFVWANGGEAFGLIPVRYPGSEASEDPMIRLSRKTQWLEDSGPGRGLGQRHLATDSGEKAILEIRRLMFTSPGGEENPAADPGSQEK